MPFCAFCLRPSLTDKEEGHWTNSHWWWYCNGCWDMWDTSLKAFKDYEEALVKLEAAQVEVMCL